MRTIYVILGFPIRLSMMWAYILLIVFLNSTVAEEVIKIDWGRIGRFIMGRTGT